MAISQSTQQSQQQLTPQARRQLEKDLRERQRELELGMSRTVELGLKSAPDGTLDVGDQAVFSYTKEMLFTQGTHHHTQLSQVRDALQRIAEGCYGICMHCESTIGGKRLQALPWTSTCLDCQERIEKGEMEAKSRVA